MTRINGNANIIRFLSYTIYCNILDVVFFSGYWPSYNVPFYEEVYNRSGYPDIVKARGTDFSYQLAPRAKIFRRDQNDVQDMASMKDIMRYNGMFVNILNFCSNFNFSGSARNFANLMYRITNISAVVLVL